MHQSLIELVNTAGKALEIEDQHILDAVAKNRTAYDGESGGIIRFNNERFYQFVVAKALISTMPYRVGVEIDSHDLVLKNPTTSEKFAVVEMKRWMTGVGNRELPKIRIDIHEKLPRAQSELKLMLVFSANPVGQMLENIEWLSEKLVVSKDLWVTHCFSTFDQQGVPIEFWTAGYQVG